MKWWIILLVILLVLVLLGIPKKQGDVLTTRVSGPPTTDQSKSSVKRAAQIAERYWGGKSRCLHIEYRYHNLKGTTIALSQWYSSSLVSKVYFQCTITFDPIKIRTSFALYCAAVVHEFGHMSGYSHSGRRNDIMYPSISTDNIPGVCQS